MPQVRIPIPDRYYEIREEEEKTEQREISEVELRIEEQYYEETAAYYDKVEYEHYERLIDQQMRLMETGGYND